MNTVTNSLSLKGLVLRHTKEMSLLHLKVFCRHHWWDLLLDADIKNVRVCVCVPPTPHPTPAPRILSFSHVLSPPFLGFTPAP